MGVDPYRTIDDLLQDKLGLSEPVKVNEAMRLGTMWEPAARAMFYFEYGVDCEPAELVHKTHPHLRASLDGLYASELFYGSRGLFLEIKYMGAKNFDKVTKEQKPLDHHWVQIQHQFLVTDIARCFYVPYTLDEQKRRIEQIAYIPVYPDAGYIGSQLEPKLHHFWEVVTKAKQGLTNGKTKDA